MIDADVAIKTDEAAAILAKIASDYLDGRRADEEVEVVDLTREPSPFLKDQGITSGRAWKTLWQNYGSVQYRVHRRGEETLVSLFNWEIYQDRQWLVRMKDAPAVPRPLGPVGRRRGGRPIGHRS